MVMMVVVVLAMVMPWAGCLARMMLEVVGPWPRCLHVIHPSQQVRV